MRELSSQLVFLGADNICNLLLIFFPVGRLIGLIVLTLLVIGRERFEFGDTVAR